MNGGRYDIPSEAFAVESVDRDTGKATIKNIGACKTINCGRGWPNRR